MITINRFVDFLAESNDNYLKLTEKDIQDISDLFLEIADKYNLKEIENRRDITTRYDRYFNVDLSDNKIFITLIVNFEYENNSEINEKIEKDFIPMLKKWGYMIYSQNSTNIMSPVTFARVKRLYYTFRKENK